MNERTYSGTVERLRSAERTARMEVERVVSLCLKDFPAKTMLDVGTGSGLFAEAFARRGLAVSGIDFKPEMIRAAQEYVPEGIFKEAPAEVIPFPQQSFDLVFFGLVLHETDDALKALQEARRVCRLPGGRAAMLEWDYRQQEIGPPLEHRLNPERLAALLRQAGFPSVQSIPLTHLVLYIAG